MGKKKQQYPQLDYYFYTSHEKKKIRVECFSLFCDVGKLRLLEKDNQNAGIENI